MYMSVHVYVSAGAHGDQQRVPDPPDYEPPDMGAGNQTEILCKSSEGSILEPSLLPLNIIF